MKGVITGDIINSRKSNSVQEWLIPLKECLCKYGATPHDWEIYRGDSFQLIAELQEIIKAAVHIKAAVKSVRNIDVRMAIGIGEVSYLAKNVTESNGTAFINSGELFQKLEKNKKNLGVRTQSEKLNNQINITLDLALIIMDDWSPGAAQVVNAQMDDEKLSQTELAKKLEISQVGVSKALQRSHYSEINDYINLITEQIKEQKR